MLRQHLNSYNPASGLFSVRRDCEEVAVHIAKILDRRFKDFDVRSVVTKGSKDTHWIEFPRIAKHWHPAKSEPVAISTELADIANAFMEIYECITTTSSSKPS